MNRDDETLLEEQFTTWLATYDEALRSGADPPSLDSGEIAPELHIRIEKALANLLLLETLRPDRGTRDGSTTKLLDSGLEGEESIDLPWSNLGRFELRRELGQGGCGLVYLAHDPLLAREVAIKVPRADWAATSEVRARFAREARAAAGLDHPNIVPVFEAGAVGPVCYLVSAYCPGITLAEWLQQQLEPIAFHTAAELMATLTDAVRHAHERGVLHRDLKPSNVMLEPPPGRGSDDMRDFVPKVTDFGMAKLPESDNGSEQTRSGIVVGTVA